LLAAEIAAHQGDLGAILLPRHLTLDAVDCPDAKANLTRHLADAGATSKMAQWSATKIGQDRRQRGPIGRKWQVWLRRRGRKADIAIRVSHVCY
jgi:hypothetical protein